MIDLYAAIINVCLQQRVIATKKSNEQFRSTLIQLIQDATDDELTNLAIDAVNNGMD